MLKFITGNSKKILEVRNSLAPVKVEQLNIDLAEIQGVDPKKILAHKLHEAFKHHSGEFIIDDSSLFLGCFDYKLPGPLVKWFNETIGTDGIFEMCRKMGNFEARAITYIAYAKNSKHVKFFKGELSGKIVKPCGKYPFGYDPIFLPHGGKLTLAESKLSGDFFNSPRGLAVLKLKKYLERGNK